MRESQARSQKKRGRKREKGESVRVLRSACVCLSVHARTYMCACVHVQERMGENASDFDTSMQWVLA